MFRIIYYFFLYLFIWNGIEAMIECPFAPKNPQDRRKIKDQLKISTFNTEWLFWSSNSNFLKIKQLKSFF